jgi:hypothetical protein
MATKKTPVNSKLLEVVAATPPANPAPTGPDLVFLRGLIRRGYTEQEITSIAHKAGMKIDAGFFAKAAEKAKKAAATREKNMAKKYAAAVSSK